MIQLIHEHGCIADSLGSGLALELFQVTTTPVAYISILTSMASPASPIEVSLTVNKFSSKKCSLKDYVP